MCSGGDTRALPRVGSPIRRSAGHRLFSTSPRLIAAVHVLHRLLTPRHPPRALRILTIEHTFCRYAVFKVRRRSSVEPSGRRPRHQRRGPPSKLNSVLPLRDPRTREPLHRYVRVARGGTDRPGVDVVSRASLARSRRTGGARRAEAGPEPWRPLAGRVPRKEVIQPQLPLRLPCYDFTPIANPTFDGCLPCGLAHRLRVLPTFVV